jgi:hypothetical protein
LMSLKSTATVRQPSWALNCVRPIGSTLGSMWKISLLLDVVNVFRQSEIAQIQTSLSFICDVQESQ